MTRFSPTFDQATASISSRGAVQLSPLFGFDEVGIDLGLEDSPRINLASERGSFVANEGPRARGQPRVRRQLVARRPEQVQPSSPAAGQRRASMSLSLRVVE